MLGAAALSACVNVALLVLLKQMLQRHHEQVVDKLEHQHNKPGNDG